MRICQLGDPYMPALHVVLLFAALWDLCAREYITVLRAVSRPKHHDTLRLRGSDPENIAKPWNPSQTDGVTCVGSKNGI